MYTWYQEEDDGVHEKKTDVFAPTVEEALFAAMQSFRSQYFRTLICGFRYTLPERDEHGNNALFHQMASSYSSPNGIYFDADAGHLCYVQNAPSVSRQLLKKLQQEKRL